MCQICNNEYDGLQELYIYGCSNVTSIPIIEGLKILRIKNCFNITNIPIIEGLQRLDILNCDILINIPVINRLRLLQIWNCPNITNIPIIEGLQTLNIIHSKHFSKYNHVFSKYNITQFHSINIIKKWYKRVKLSKKLWLYAELVIMDEMNPHKDNNQYLERYIKEKVYN